MIDKNIARLRRASKARAVIARIKAVRLSVHRTNSHIYAQVFDTTGGKVLAAASTAEKALRAQLKNGGNKDAAVLIGKEIAARARKAGVEAVAFDRAGYSYHGRIKALADAAREGGLKF